MAADIRSTAQSNSIDAPTIDVTVPAGVQDGDVLDLSLHIGVNQSVGAPSISSGLSGWTLVEQRITGAHAVAVYRRVASSEPASYTVTFSYDLTCFALMIAMTGIDTTTPLDGTPTNNLSSSTTSHSATGLTTSKVGALLICSWSSTSHVGISPPAGMTSRLQGVIPGTVFVSGLTATELLAAAGATGARVATSPINISVAMVTRAYRPKGPSQPAAFITPTLNQVHTIGANMVVDWGDATDPDFASNTLVYDLEFSNNGGAWSLLTTTAAGVTSYTYDFTGDAAGTTNKFRVRARNTDGTNGPYVESALFTLRSDAVPLAPTNLTPANGIVVSDAVDVPFRWTFNDPGDVQSAFTLRYSTDPTFTTFTEVIQSTSLGAWDEPIAATGTYYWRVKTADQAAQYGPYSADATFVLATGPAAPVITSPADAGTVTVARPTVTWTSAGQAQYRLRITDTSDNELWSSGWVVSAGTSRQIGIDLNNGTTYRVKLAIRDSNGLESSEDSNEFDVVFTPPSAPTITGATDTTLFRMSISVTNALSFTELHLYRYEASAGSSTAIRIGLVTVTVEPTIFFDYDVRSGVEYIYFVRGFNGTTVFTDSTTVSLTLTIEGLIITLPRDPFNYNLILLATAGTFDPENISREIVLKGREYPVESFTGNKRAIYSFAAWAVTQAEIELLIALFNTQEILLVRIGGHPVSVNSFYGVLKRMPMEYHIGQQKFVALSFERRDYTVGV